MYSGRGVEEFGPESVDEELHWDQRKWRKIKSDACRGEDRGADRAKVQVAVFMFNHDLLHVVKPFLLLLPNRLCPPMRRITRGRTNVRCVHTASDHSWFLTEIEEGFPTGLSSLMNTFTIRVFIKQNLILYMALSAKYRSCELVPKTSSGRQA